MVTRDELYEEAKSLGIEGRSEMDKDELEEAIADARARGVTAASAPGELSREEIESGWTRGADPDDAEAVAAAAEQARLANMGSTGSTMQYGGPPATGGAKPRPVAEVAAEEAEIRGAAAAREAQKVEQTGATNTTPSPDQEGAVEDGKPAVEEAGTGDAESGDKADAKSEAKADAKSGAKSEAKSEKQHGGSGSK